MKLDAETRSTMTYLTGLAILISQIVVFSLAGQVSELLVGAALMICIPETLRILRGGKE